MKVKLKDSPKIIKSRYGQNVVGAVLYNFWKSPSSLLQKIVLYSEGKQMKIMVIEDDDVKWKSIKNHLNNKGISDIEIIRAKNMAEFSANLSANIGLFIIDFRLPGYENAQPLQNGIAILEAITMEIQARRTPFC